MLAAAAIKVACLSKRIDLEKNGYNVGLEGEKLSQNVEKQRKFPYNFFQKNIEDFICLWYFINMSQIN